MPLVQLVVHAVVAAFTEAAGMSGAAHAMALGLWIAPPEPSAIAGAAGLGTGLGAVIALRARLFPALSEGARAVSHPASFLSQPRAREALVFAWIPAVSAVLSLALRSAGAAPPPSPRTLAIGLGVTGVALFLAAQVGRWRAESGTAGRAGSKGAAAPRDVPSLAGATLAGAAHAFGVWPGASRVGLAAAVLLAIGVRPARALPFAIGATVPFWWGDFVRALPDAGALGKGQASLVAVFAFLGAFGAAAALRALAQRRALVALPLWMIPLSCAIFAYAGAT